MTGLSIRVWNCCRNSEIESVKMHLKRPFISVWGFCSLMALSNPALADFELPGDASSEERSAYEVLDKYCARCHQEGRLEGLDSPKAKFGNILELRAIAENPRLIVKGKPENSRLLGTIGTFAFGLEPMPYDCKYDDNSCFPSDAEKQAISDWISALGNEKSREFVSVRKIVELARVDLESTNPIKIDRIRYISLRPLHNDSRLSAKTLAGLGQGAVKMLNALSLGSTVYQAEKVDSDGVLLRIDITDLGWDAEKWEYIASFYPYGFKDDDNAALDFLVDKTGTNVPILRADWLAANATVPPLYNKILELPNSFQDLVDYLGVDYEENIRDGKVVRVGIKAPLSGVSQHNRLIERHQASNGFFWTSYDFSGSEGQQNLLKNPLGPKGIFETGFAFEHDGGESIFTLPNGYHAYYLNGPDGQILEVGPNNIVEDKDYGFDGRRVINGISCISCHDRGMRTRADNVRGASCVITGLETANAISFRCCILKIPKLRITFPLTEKNSKKSLLEVALRWTSKSKWAEVVSNLFAHSIIITNKCR